MINVRKHDCVDGEPRQAFSVSSEQHWGATYVIKIEVREEKDVQVAFWTMRNQIFYLPLNFCFR